MNFTIKTKEADQLSKENMELKEALKDKQSYGTSKDSQQLKKL